MSCFAAPHSSEPCSGPDELHHVLKQQTIRSRLRTTLRDLRIADRKAYERIEDEALGDIRNMVVCCNLHHQRITNARIKFTRDVVPESVERFARDHGLEPALDREYGPRHTTEAA